MHHFVMAAERVGRRERGEALKKSQANCELWLQRAHSTFAVTAQAPRQWSRLGIPLVAQPP